MSSIQEALDNFKANQEVKLNEELIKKETMSESDSKEEIKKLKKLEAERQKELEVQKKLADDRKKILDYACSYRPSNKIFEEIVDKVENCPEMEKFILSKIEKTGDTNILFLGSNTFSEDLFKHLDFGGNQKFERTSNLGLISLEKHFSVEDFLENGKTIESVSFMDVSSEYSRVRDCIFLSFKMFGPKQHVIKNPTFLGYKIRSYTEGFFWKRYKFVFEKC